MRCALAALLGTLFATAAATGARAAEPALGLESLEARVDTAPGVLALARQIDADVAAEGVATGRSGLDYTFDNGLGPRSDIVLDNVNNNTLRYAQSVGLQLPILGTAYGQKNALAEARKVEALARIAFQDDRRHVLALVRDAYVSYWQFDRQEAIAQAYADRLERDLHAARALRRSGFWTEANLLDYLQTLARFRTAAIDDRTSRRAQLTIIASALGTDVAPFHPLDPAFGTACAPREDGAIASALAIDPGLAKIDADRDDVRSQLERVRGSSIDARVQADVGTVADIVPPRAGYDVTAGVAVALPTHARSEERSLRAQLEDLLDAERLQTEQRRADVSATVREAIDDLDAARADLRQAEIEEASARENLREAEVRYRTIPGLGAVSFNDVQARVAEQFVSENATAAARAAVLLKTEALLAIAPEACSR